MDDHRALPSINLDSPRYDQTTYVGRVKHFFVTTNPLNFFATNRQLEEAKQTIQDYRRGILRKPLTEDELWRAKHLYDSAYHPDTGDKMALIGRMSAQVPMNMAITGCMMTFYKSNSAILFWQWMNQSLNAVVNYTNRSGDASISNRQLLMSYVAATTAATGTGIGLKSLVKNMPPLVGRYVPFGAVIAANFINIPMMRNRELQSGIPVYISENFSEDTRVADSRKAAQKAIPQVIVSRICMAFGPMLIPPIIMQRLERGILKGYPVLNAPTQIMLVGLCLTFTLPLCCAFFPQKSSLAVDKLEPDIQQKLRKMGSECKCVYYNKGL